jgi:hypothetical protein
MSQQVCGFSLSNLEDLFQRVASVANPRLRGKIPQLSLEQKMMVAILKLRQNFSFHVLGWMFDASVNVVYSAWSEMLPLLYKAVAPAVHMNRGFPIRFMGNTIRYIVDGWEHRIGASSNTAIEKVCYSVKKKQHSFTQLIYVSPDGYICYVTRSFTGSTSDSTIAAMKQNDLTKYMQKNHFILGDKGFVGLESYGIVSAFPNEDTFKMRIWNKTVKKWRIVVENSVRELRIFKILKHEYQTKLLTLQKSLDAHSLIVYICAALVNLYFGPRRSEDFFEEVR